MDLEKSFEFFCEKKLGQTLKVQETFHQYLPIQMMVLQANQVLAKVDFPDPLSPTTPRVSPFVVQK